MTNSAPIRLQTVSSTFESEAREIESAFVLSDISARVTKYAVLYVPHDDGCVVSLWDAWNRFLRTLTLTSCSGPTSGILGSSYIPRAPLSEAAALASIRQNGIHVVGGEPKWYDTRTLGSVLQVLRAPNEAVIVGAVASGSVNLGSINVMNPLPEIQTLRNFIAHKSARMLANAQRYMNGTILDVHSHLRERTLGGLPRFSEWTDVLVALADAACS